ncbi:EF-hand calcium-binding domain-containing protein 6 [Scleropages formosus]|uniref:EF-hand calcium-binding domain-containing protein 6 n=1 Tax=Scleropages formosus TaxID=113540 RepID=UPI0010FAB089|nr:EF-hand calcium-binding domain-containing protein 6 [Scleropages formosus]
MSDTLFGNGGLGDLRPASRGLVIGQRSRSVARPSAGSHESQMSRHKALQRETAASVQSLLEENLSAVQFEDLVAWQVQEKKEDLKAAFRALDPERRLSVTKGEFRRVIEGHLLALTHAQLEMLLAKAPKKVDGTISYLEFLRQYCKILTTKSRRPQSPGRCMMLAEIQRRLREKIEGNVKGIIRAFRLFDYNRDGKIQHHELRRVLEAFCFPMNDREFHRLWSHYSPNNTGAMSYKEFLEKLGIHCENHGKFVQESAKLALNWCAVSQDEKGASCRRAKRKAVPFQRLTLEEIQTIYLQKMRVNYSNVHKALQASDSTQSGLVSREDLKAVLSNFLYPLSDITFQSLMNRYGIKATGPVSWRQFLTQFMNLAMGDEQTLPGSPQTTSCKEDLAQDIPADLQKLKEHNKDEKVTLEELNRVVDSLNVRLIDNQFGELMTLLDPDHSGVISNRDSLDIIDPQRQSKVQGLLQDKLLHQFNTVMVALQQCDSSRRGIVSQGELRNIIKQSGLPLSDTHFKNLLCRKEDSNHIHAENRGRKMVQDMALKGIHKSLAMRSCTIHDHLRTMQKTANGVLTIKNLRRMLEDCEIFLEEDHFCTLVEVLGFKDEKLSQSEFLAKYKESMSRASATDPKNKPMEDKPANFSTAEQCLSLMKKRIMEFHGDIHTAFRLMDKNHDGLVSRPDFKDLYSSLRFITKQTEYQRLLDLLGLTPGATLNYPEFLSLVQSNASKVAHLCASSRAKLFLDQPCDDVHSYLVLKARTGWPDMAKALCHFDRDSQGIIFKNDLRNLLYTYAVPLTPKEFNQLWLRYDKEGKGCITQSEFLRNVGLDPEDKGHDLYKMTFKYMDTESKGRTSNAGSQTHHAMAKLHSLWKAVRQNQEELSASLRELGEGVGEGKDNGDYVTVEELLALLQKHCDHIELEGEEELIHLLNSVGIDVHNGKLSHLDFLSTFDARAKVPSNCCTELPVLMDRMEKRGLEKAVLQVRELVTTSAKTLSKAFSAFDKTGSGTVNLQEFRQVLDSFCLKLSDHQYVYLLSKMSVKQGDDAVNWRTFLHCCTLSCQETSEEWKQRMEKAAHSSETHPMTVSDILGQIHKVISSCLCTLTKEKMDLDNSHIVISKKDLKTVCDHHFMRLTDDQFEKLWNRLPVNSFGNLEYRRFLKCFNKDFQGCFTGLEDGALGKAPSPPQGFTIRQRPKTSSYCIGLSKPADATEYNKRPSTAGVKAVSLLSSELLEKKLQDQVRACWRVIQKRCRELDKERLGEIDMDKFLAIMEDLHIEMSQQELEQLAMKYNIKNNGRLSYPGFLQNTVLALRPPARRAFGRPKVPQPRTPMSAGVLSGPCLDAMLRMQGLVQQFRRGLRQNFVTLDRNRTGSITVQDLRKVLRLYSIKLSEEEFFHLCSFFDKNISGKISYDDFLHTFLG